MQAATTIVGTALTLEDAVRQQISQVADNTPFTVKDITENLRKTVNDKSLTISDLTVNDLQAFVSYGPSGGYERQSIPYSTVREAFVELLPEFPLISFEVDPTGTYRIYTKQPDNPKFVGDGLTAQFPLTSTIQTHTGHPGPSVTVSNPALAPAPALRSLAERVLDGSITHRFTVELNGETLILNKRQVFSSKEEATTAVEDRLRDVLGLSDKEVSSEIKSLVREGVLEFVRRKV